MLCCFGPICFPTPWNYSKSFFKPYRVICILLPGGWKRDRDTAVPPSCSQTTRCRWRFPLGSATEPQSGWLPYFSLPQTEQRDGYTPADLLRKRNTKKTCRQSEGWENESIDKKQESGGKKKTSLQDKKKKEPSPIYIRSCSTQGAPAICDRFFISCASKAAISVSQALLDWQIWRLRPFADQ